jgi:hypothetical protein
VILVPLPLSKYGWAQRLPFAPVSLQLLIRDWSLLMSITLIGSRPRPVVVAEENNQTLLRQP